MQYRDVGSGPCILLIHGLFVDSRVWDWLVPLLAPRARCVMPDLPLGAHRTPMNPDADLSPPGLARLIAELIRELRLRDVTVLGNDTGGALCQVLCANHPELVGRLVLTNCDAFERFPPAAFQPVYRAGPRIPGSMAAVDLLLRVRPLRHAALAAVPVTMRPLPDALLASWFEALHDRRIRADLRAVLAGISPEHTLSAAERLKTFERPALIAWGTCDRFFPLSDARRLAATLPHARLETIDDARTYVQVDQPQRLAELIAG